jgi:glucokinase
VDFPFPVLVGDIGGTNARFAIISEPGAPPSPAEHRATHAFPSLEAALAAALPQLPEKPRSIIACAAGPVEDRSVIMTNAHWTIEGSDVAKAHNLEQGLLLNDFEAQALTLPVLKDEWVKVLGEPVPESLGARLVLGPGTGLGASALLEIDGKHFALASEAGHVDFGPVGAEESAIWPHLPMTQHGRISAETVLSGPGLVRLHLARLTARGAVNARTLTEHDLVATAHADRHGDEADTVRLFWRLAARFAGDMTLAFLATGGVTFSGGVLPRLVSFVDPAVFRARYEDKAPFGDLLRNVGTRLIVVDDAVLSGLGAIAARPQDYAINYERRAWC